MGLQFYKRINLGKGFGLNISKSGISSSFRSKIGSIGSRGFSIRSGIPGLSYRRRFSGSSNRGCLVVFMMMFFLGFALACTENSEECESKTCSDFQTQSQAQSTFDSNPSCYENLDMDNDNIPCENLPD